MGIFDRWMRKQGLRKVPDANRWDRRSRTEDLYRTDLDRHLWSLRSERAPRGRGRLTRLLASAAGMAGAAGLSYWAYRRLRGSRDSSDGDAGSEGARDGDTAGGSKPQD